MTTTVQDALSLLLASMGFGTMASDVLTENDEERIARYARIVRKNAAKVSADFGARANKVLTGFGV